MKIIADFHIHSKYSRATSPQMDLEHLNEAAKIKGVQVISTGDFTHPAWFRELKDKLKPAEPGLFVLDKTKNATRFILTTEISCIYSKNGKVRKAHILIFAPDLATVEKINNQLSIIGNLRADGRPILGLDAKELAKIAWEANPDCLVVPAHCWTPWFAVFGSKSGFNSLEECFEEQTKNIFAVETGLSSDPAMNWQLSGLDKVALISCSDAHSAPKIGREACVFDTDLSYPAIIEAIKNKNPQKFLYTIEFFPEEGKYHYDGHRLCNVHLSPLETKKYRGICPVCGRPLVIGVASRVAELADRQEGFIPPKSIPYKRLIPLTQVIAEVLGVGESTKKAQEVYQRLVLNKLGTELDILIDCPIAEIETAGGSALALAIQKMRAGQVNIEPGYDGVYGKINILSAKEKKDLSVRQIQLF
ncbi:MAG: endonuclease Q family protein [Candidatus Gribaldobacteria bacterium]|nr:endonuclease Q family protein [Candidatus Gribaldobacteria bacterium]